MTDQLTPIIRAVDPAVIPSDVKKKIARGRADMRRDAPKRRLCARFERGDTYWHLTEKGTLGYQDTVTFATGGGKPKHRIRNRYNFIRPIVQGKVSQATQRVPGYDIAPTSSDADRVGAAKLASQVALYGYDKWNLSEVTKKVAILAIGHGGDGFALPYFDTRIGPFTPVPDPVTGMPVMVGQGEISVLILSGNEVYWEAGVDFMRSRWFATERAEPIDEIMQIPGFYGEQLVPDASTSDIPTDKPDNNNLAILTTFYERPCPQYPNGRRFFIANNRVICDQRRVNPLAESSWEDYPLKGPGGQVIDEPILHRLSYNLDPETDRDFGLTWQLIDPQRTIQDAWNKILEWKNRCLNPRWKAPVGSLITRPNDEPGGVDYYRPVGNLAPELQDAPPIPDSLFRVLEQMKQDMREIASDEQLEAAANVAAATVSAVLAQSQAKWASFLGDLAQFHSRLMRHCLTLVATNYTEPRLLKIRGRNGWEQIQDFKGSDLMGETDVRVMPGSLEYLTKEQLTARVMAFADRGWITPQQAMVAIDQGTSDALVQSLELDLGRANRIIQRVRDGSAMDMPPRVETDPASGQLVEIPGWMPQDLIDNLDVWRSVFADYAKTDDFERLQPDRQEIIKLVINGIQQLAEQDAQRKLLMQNAAAEQLGMNNASKPQQAKALPDQSSANPPTAQNGASQ